MSDLPYKSIINCFKEKNESSAKLYKSGKENKLYNLKLNL